MGDAPKWRVTLSKARHFVCVKCELRLEVKKEPLNQERSYAMRLKWLIDFVIWEIE